MITIKSSDKTDCMREISRSTIHSLIEGSYIQTINGKAGDIVSVDIGACYHGYHADSRGLIC